MRDWVLLLAGCVLFGASIVTALVLPRHASPLALIAGISGMFASVTSFGSLASRYDSPEAIAGSMVVFIAGITAGYAVASTSLPYLRRSPRPVRVPPAQGDGDGVILVSCSDPERYDPSVVTKRQNLLDVSADIVVPVTALPFVYFAEKARYRAIGGRAPGVAVARQLAERVLEMPEAAEWKIELAWCHSPDSLPRAAASLATAGVSRIAVVALGLPESGPLDAAQESLADALRAVGAPTITQAPTIWNDRLLPERLAERIIAATMHSEPAEVGVVLVGEGAPPAWERRYAASAEAETYFDQRVRALLGEAGIDERHIRMCWLEWQMPDVTETVRHVAALGCTRIVVAPSTIALPTLQTSLDLAHAIALARVPAEVLVVTLQPWGEDEGFADAVRRTASAALARLQDTESDA